MTYYTVVAVKNDTIFYLTDQGYATDIPANAAAFESRLQAETIAKYENNQQHVWQGFHWQISLEETPDWNEGR